MKMHVCVRVCLFLFVCFEFGAAPRHTQSSASLFTAALCAQSSAGDDC